MALYQEKHRVASTRLKGWDYRSRGWYFVTLCAQNHACVFGEIVEGEVQPSRLGLILESELRLLPTHYDKVEVDAQVVMPNHMHAIVVIEGEQCFSPRARMMPDENAGSGFISPKAGSLSALVRCYKSGVTRRCHELGLNIACQSRFHDDLLRGDKVIAAVREYIRNNPVNWWIERTHFAPSIRRDIARYVSAGITLGTWVRDAAGRDVASNVSTTTLYSGGCGHLSPANRTSSSGLHRNGRHASLLDASGFTPPPLAV